MITDSKKWITAMLVFSMVFSALSIYVLAENKQQSQSYPWEQGHAYNFYLASSDDEPGQYLSEKYFVTNYNPDEAELGKSLYLHDGDTMTKTKLLEAQALSLEYCVHSEDPIVFLNNARKEIIRWHNGNADVCYIAESKISRNLGRVGTEYIVFFDGDKLVKIDMVTEAVEILGDNFKIDGFDGDKQLGVLGDPNYIAWGAVTPDMEEVYVYNVETGENVYINEVKRSARNAPYDPWSAAVEYLDWKDRI